MSCRSRDLEGWPKGDWLPQPAGAGGLGLPSSGGAQQSTPATRHPEYLFTPLFPIIDFISLESNQVRAFGTSATSWRMTTSFAWSALRNTLPFVMPKLLKWIASKCSSEGSSEPAQTIAADGGATYAGDPRNPSRMKSRCRVSRRQQINYMPQQSKICQRLRAVAAARSSNRSRCPISSAAISSYIAAVSG